MQTFDYLSLISLFRESEKLRAQRLSMKEKETFCALFATIKIPSVFYSFFI
jgi:hypothetical protein